jgi:DNA-binding FadR family transcriptional regulator
LAWEEMRLSTRNWDTIINREAFVAADLRFHYAILRASHNELLYQVGSLTGIMLRKSFSIMTQTGHQLSTTLRRHKEILDGIAAGNQIAVKRLMERIIVASTAELRTALDHRARQTLTVKRALRKLGQDSLG